MDTFFLLHGAPTLSVDHGRHAGAELLQVVAARHPRGVGPLGDGHADRQRRPLHNDTIHDFHGFPGQMYKVTLFSRTYKQLTYPAPGAPDGAERTKQLLEDSGFGPVPWSRCASSPCRVPGSGTLRRTICTRNGGATVLRVNMPPGPFITGDSRVVAFLDARSFSVVLDDAKGGQGRHARRDLHALPRALWRYRPLSFLDAADTRHATLKRIVIRLAAARMHHVAPAFRTAFDASFDTLDAGLRGGSGSPVQFNKLNEHHMFDFTCYPLFGRPPPNKAMGYGAVTKAIKWLAVWLHPLASKIIKPWPLEDLLLHTFRLPPFLVRRDY